MGFDQANKEFLVKQIIRIKRDLELEGLSLTNEQILLWIEKKASYFRSNHFKTIEESEDG